MKIYKPIHTDLTVASLYHFATMRDLELKRSSLRSICDEQNILGTILLATVGVNGTITGEYDCIQIVIDAIVANLAQQVARVAATHGAIC